MDSQANVEFVWRKIWRRFWYDDFKTPGLKKCWRRVLKEVPANYSPPATYPAPSTDPQLITYADCEAFFDAVTEGSRKDLIKILNTHGPAVTTELSKSYNEHGETPLLVAIQRGNLDVVKFLVGKLDVPIGQIGRFLWRDVEYLDVPALYVAIVCGEMDIAAYLLSKEVGSDQTVQMRIDSIVSSPNGRQEKINILELMGAVNFYFYESHPAPRNGLMYWREAMNLRQSTLDGKPAIPKTIVPSDFAGMNFGFNTSEFTTLEQLEQLSLFELFTQAILVSKRVLNIVSPGPHIFTLIFLCQCASVYFFRQGRRGHAINILTFFLQQSQELHMPEIKKSKFINWVLYIMSQITIDLSQKPSIDNDQVAGEEFTFANRMVAFDFATSYMSVLQENRQQEKIEPETVEYLASCILDMIYSLNGLMPKLNPEECQQFESSLSLFIRKDHRWGVANRNLLQTICDLYSRQIVDMPPAENVQRWNVLMDNDSDSDDGSGLMGDRELDVNLDVFSDNNSAESDVDSDCDGDLNDNQSNEANSNEIDENQDVVSRFPSWRYRYARINCSEDTDVDGCSSCGHGGENSSDEADDENFELMRNHHQEMEIREDEANDDVLASSSEDLQLSTTQLILRLGADPNATDLYGFTPLHLLAMNRESVAQSRMLLEYGGHIDQADVISASTPLMHFQGWQNHLAFKGNPDLNLQSLISNVLPLPLTCLAAQVLSKNQIAFDKEKVPTTLHSFIQRH